MDSMMLTASRLLLAADLEEIDRKLAFAAELELRKPAGFERRVELLRNAAARESQAVALRQEALELEAMVAKSTRCPDALHGFDTDLE